MTTDGPKSAPEITTDLPPDLLVLVGQIVVLWATIEQRLIKLIYNAANIPNKYGRLLVGNINPDKIISTLESVLEVEFKEIAAEAGELSGLKDLVRRATIERNQLVHGTWYRYPGQSYPVLRLVTGERAKEKRNTNLRPRKIDPDGKLITPDILVAQIGDLETIMNRLEWLREVALRNPRKIAKSENGSW